MYCIDTGILVSAFAGKNIDGSPEQKKAAAQFKSWVLRENPPLMLTTPVISEFLTADIARANQILSVLRAYTEIHPFDNRSAKKAAELQIRRQNGSEASGENEPGQSLTNDIMICAIAIKNGADAIVTMTPKRYQIGRTEGLSIYDFLQGPPGQATLELDVGAS